MIGFGSSFSVNWGKPSMKLFLPDLCWCSSFSVNWGKPSWNLLLIFQHLRPFHYESGKAYFSGWLPHQLHWLQEICELSKTIMKIVIPYEFFQNQNFYGNLELILKWLLLELALMPINKKIHILCLSISFEVHL